MSTTTQHPNSDISSSGCAIIGGSASDHAAISDGSDSTSIEFTCGTPSNCVVGLSATAADFSTPSAWAGSFRVAQSGKHPDVLTAQIFKSDGTTALTNQVTLSTTTTITTLTPSFTIQGSPTKADCDGARLKITTDGSGVNDTTIDVYEASDTLTYTPSASPPIGTIVQVSTAVRQGSRW